VTFVVKNSFFGTLITVIKKGYSVPFAVGHAKMRVEPGIVINVTLIVAINAFVTSKLA
jgi:hypothetical protein